MQRRVVEVYVVDTTTEKKVQGNARSTCVRLGVVSPTKIVEFQDLFNKRGQALLSSGVPEGRYVTSDQRPRQSRRRRAPSECPGSFIHGFQEWEYVPKQLTDVAGGHRELRIVNQLVHRGHRQQPLRSPQLCHCSV